MKFSCFEKMREARMIDLKKKISEFCKLIVMFYQNICMMRCFSQIYKTLEAEIRPYRIQFP